MSSIKKISIVLTVITLDQFFKYLIRSSGGFYICNKGIAFGVSFPVEMLVFLWGIFLIFVLCCIFGGCEKVYLGKDERVGKDSKKVSLWGKIDVDWCFNLYFYLLLGGGLSNLIDRVFLGCVIDFISVGSFPLFNIADVFISFGAIMLILGISKSENKRH